MGLPTLVVARTLYSDDAQRLAALLRQIRVKAGLNQAEVAERLDRPQSFVSKYEAGQRRLDLIEVRDICLAIGTTLTSVARRFDKGA